MNYLLTGVAGFIGAATARQLLEQGHRVVGCDNLNDYYDTRLKHYRLHELATFAGVAQPVADALEAKFRLPSSNHRATEAFAAERFRYQTLDIEDKAAVLALFEEERFDGVLNLAARAGVRYSMENPDVYMTTNTMGVLHLLEGMRRTNVPKLVQASTSSLYAGLATPFVESLPVNTPISPYAASKKASEVLAYTYHHLYGIDVSVVRYFTVFGPAGRPDMSPLRFIKWIEEGTPIELFGDGSQSRDFTYVEDIAAGTIAALKQVGYDIFNLGGGNNPISINQMIVWFEEMLGKSARIDHKPFHKADMRVTWADISKAKAQLAWEPKVSPKEGFSRMVEWFRANVDWLSTVKL